MPEYDFIVIGAGIVGLATAMRLQERYPEAALAVVEKEARPATHQSGHNSGVMHAGVYYEPGSLKARLCRAGLAQMVDFCRRQSIPFRQCGKLIVATDAAESVRLQHLHERAVENGVECRMLNARKLKQVEPNVCGVGALQVAETGIVDYAQVCRKMAEVVAARGGVIMFGAHVTAIDEDAANVRVETSIGTLTSGRLIACAGLHSDRVAALAGLGGDFAILPFRGDFYRLSPRRADIVRHLIYPVPDPALPFLGVHLTATIDGGMTVGPSAMLALKREGYTKTAVSLSDVAEMVRYPGLWRLLSRYPQAGLSECVHALSRRAYLRAIKRYCPSIERRDLAEHHCGVRAQAVSRDGRLIHDFLIERTPRTVHICNAPSPAATASLPIADAILDGLDGTSPERSVAAAGQPS